jgi:hypothetical protein
MAGPDYEFYERVDVTARMVEEGLDAISTFDEIFRGDPSEKGLREAVSAIYRSMLLVKMGELGEVDCRFLRKRWPEARAPKDNDDLRP